MLWSSQGPGFAGGGTPLWRRGAQRSPGRESLGVHHGGSLWQGDPREPCPLLGPVPAPCSPSPLTVIYFFLCGKHHHEACPPQDGL